MSFETYETSRAEAAPINLYYFRYGETADAFFAYTDAEEVITFGGVAYQPIPIKRDSVKASGTLDKSTMQVNTPQNTELADLFKLYPPSQVVTLIIRQGHAFDPDAEYLVTWTGRVLGCKRQGNEAIYTCEPIATSLKRPGLRRNYQYGCPHVLYGPQCKANKTAATISRMALTVSGPYVTLADNWATEDRKPKYIGGMVEWIALDGRKEIRTVLKLKGVHNEQLLLSGISTGLVAGMSLDIILGCNHQAGLTDDCIVLHNNISNYGGQPWIPFENPIGIKNNFY